jgi:sugar phosphate permease
MLKTAYGDVVAQASAEDRTYARVTWRLIPFLFLCDVFAYLDRVNVGLAKLRMLTDLKFSETVYGLGAGIFLIGYFISEVPSNIALETRNDRRPVAGRCLVRVRKSRSRLLNRQIVLTRRV